MTAKAIIYNVRKKERKGTMKCPICGGELKRSTKNPEYGLCHTCRKKFRWKDEPEDYELYEPKKKNPVLKGCFTFFIIVVIIVSAVVFLPNLFSQNSNEKSADSTNENVIESNSSEMVDYLAKKAKADCDTEDIEIITNEAVNFLSSNYPDYFIDNETMENVIYYGFFLEYANEDSNQLYAKLGQDACQSVKYVYRGVDSSDDEETQENIRQVGEELKELGLVE